MSALYRVKTPFHLVPADREDVENLLRDRYQSPRARRRARALLMMDEAVAMTEVSLAVEMDEKALLAMIERYKKGGVRGAVFGVERTKSTLRYDLDAIATVLRELVDSRPPAGTYWTMKSLTEAVAARVVGAADISSEYVRQVMVKRLKIRSVRHIEPFWLRQVRKSEAGVAA